MKAKSVLVALVLMLAMTGMPEGGRVPVTQAASQYLRVAVSSSYPGDVPQYTLTFALTTMIHKGDTLTLTFDTKVARAKDGDPSPSSIVLDATSVPSSAAWSGSTLKLIFSTDLAVGAEHVLVVGASALIQNPRVAGHYQITLDHPASKTTLISNYYAVMATTQLIPLDLEPVVEHFQTTGVRIRVKTGRSGALTGHDPIGVDFLGAPVYPDREDTVTIRLSDGLSRLWRTAGTVKLQPLYSSYPLVSTIPTTAAVLSSTIYDTSEAGTDLLQLVLNLPHNVPASTELCIYLMFKTAQSASTLLDAEYVRVYTTKETAVVTVPPQTTETGSEAEPEPPADVVAPTVTWSYKASTLLPRLVTLSVNVTEEHLDEAWFSGGTGSLTHTRLATGSSMIMLINRTGIHGTIVATDKAGNTTTVSVDLPVPSGT